MWETLLIFVAAVFLTTTADRHTWQIAGLSALERRIREIAKTGGDRVVVAAAPIELPRPLPIPVDFVAADTPPPKDSDVQRADVIAGIELVDADACRRAEWALIRRSNKSFEGPVDALINWRFSMRITRLLARRSLAVTPNHVTIVAILVGLCASACAAGWLGLHGWAQFALAGLLLEVNSILDSVDGELARLRFQYSKAGQWLDNLADDIVDNSFVALTGYALGGPWMYIAFATAGGRILVAIYQYISVYARTGTGDVFAFRWWFEGAATTTDAVYDPKKVSTWLRSFGRRDTFVFVWMLACLAGFPYWVIGHAAVIAATYVGLMLLQTTVFRRHM